MNTECGELWKVCCEFKSHLGVWNISFSCFYSFLEFFRKFSQKKTNFSIIFVWEIKFNQKYHLKCIIWETKMFHILFNWIKMKREKKIQQSTRLSSKSMKIFMLQCFSVLHIAQRSIQCCLTFFYLIWLFNNYKFFSRWRVSFCLSQPIKFTFIWYFPYSDVEIWFGWVSWGDSRVSG